jgi:hypothetical protein
MWILYVYEEPKKKFSSDPNPKFLRRLNSVLFSISPFSKVWHFLKIRSSAKIHAKSAFRGFLSAKLSSGNLTLGFAGTAGAAFTEFLKERIDDE